MGPALYPSTNQKFRRDSNSIGPRYGPARESTDSTAPGYATQPIPGRTLARAYAPAKTANQSTSNSAAAPMPPAMHMDTTT